MTGTANADDPLTELLVDAADLDRRALANALKGRISIDSTTGRFRIESNYAKLNAKQKVLGFLLARKASTLLSLSGSESLTFSEVTEISSLRAGTVGPALRDLIELRMADQDDNKAYFVPNALITRAIQFIEEART